MSDDEQEEVVDLSEPPRTWKQAILVENELKKQKIKEQATNQQEQQKKNEKTNSADPLGLMTSKVRAFRNRQSRWGATLHQETKEETVDIAQESFNPGLFLSTIHHGMRYEDLDTANENLATSKRKLNHAMKTLVKDNLDKFISAKDEVDKLIEKGSQINAKSVETIETVYNMLQLKATELYSPLIKRKKEAEEINEILGKLKKYRFIFFLPSDIKDNTSKGDYSKVVHDYTRAKYFLRSQKQQQNSLFQPLIAKFDKQIIELRQDLLNKLTIPHDPIGIFERRLLGEEEERLIGYLIELDCDTDPSWFYLNQMHKCVDRLLESCVTEWQTKLLTIESMRKRQIDLDKRWQEIINDPSNKEKSPTQSEQQQLNLNQKEIMAQFDSQQQTETLTLVQKMIQIILFIIPDFYQLSQNMLSGKYQKQTTRKGLLKTKQLKEQAAKEQKIVNLLNSLFSNLSEKVNNAIANLDDKRAHQSILCACVGEVLRCWEKLSMLPTIPAAFLSSLGDYAQGLRKFIIGETWTRSIKEIATFYVHEDWVNINEKLSITKLPIEFKDHVYETINLLKPFIRPDDPMKPEITEHLLATLSVFADNLHHLAFDHPTERKLLMVLSNIAHTKNVIIRDVIYAFVGAFRRAKERTDMNEYNNNSKQNEEEEQDESEQEQAEDSENNEDEESRYEEEEEDNDTETRTANDNESEASNNDEQGGESVANIEREVQELSAKFQAQENVNSVMFLYDELSVVVVDRFVAIKARSLVQYVEKGVLLSGYNWANAPKPVTIRPFILEILLELALVHSRVEKVTKNYKENITEFSEEAEEASSAIFNETSIAYYDFTNRIFRKLTERLAEIFNEYVCNLPEVSDNAAFQMDIEIAFIRRALRVFETKTAKQIYNKVCRFLTEVSEYRPKASSRVQLKEQILEEMQERTRLQLGCFQERDIDEEQQEQGVVNHHGCSNSRF